MLNVFIEGIRAAKNRQICPQSEYGEPGGGPDEDRRRGGVEGGPARAGGRRAPHQQALHRECDCQPR